VSGTVDRRRPGSARSLPFALLVGVLALVALVGGGCGIADDSHPRAIARSAVPYDLLSPTTSPVTGLTPNLPRDNAILYLADEEERVVRGVNRDVARPVNLSQVLRQLIDARHQPDDPPGLSNLISRRTKLIEVRTAKTVSGGQRVTINLDQFFPGLSSDDVSLAIAQVVFTVDQELRNQNGGDTGQPVSVQFQVRGQKKDIRTSDGQTKAEVTVDDFAAFDPNKQPADGERATSTTSTAILGQAPKPSGPAGWSDSPGSTDSGG
jgi:hypothetical protein